MKVEITEYYPAKFKKGKTTYGSMSLYIVDLKMDIKFCRVINKKQHWYFELPHQFVIEDGKKIKVPIINFVENEKNIELRKSFIEEAKKFIKDWKPEI